VSVVVDRMKTVNSDVSVVIDRMKTINCDVSVVVDRMKTVNSDVSVVVDRMKRNASISERPSCTTLTHASLSRGMYPSVL